MNLDVEALVNSLRDVALSTNKFAVIKGHEPTTPLSTDGLTAGVWLQKIGTCKRISGLSSTAAATTFTFRIFVDALTGTATPQELDAIDPAVGAATVAVMGGVIADFTLDGRAFIVDILGLNGVPMGAQAGYANVSGTVYRVMDTTIPILLDGVWPQEAVA